RADDARPLDLPRSRARGRRRREAAHHHRRAPGARALTRAKAMTGRRSGHRERARRAAEAGERSWVIGFGVRLLIGWALALALLPGIDRTAVAGTVWSVNAVLHAIAFHPEITGTTIRLGTAALQIIPECTPVMPVLLLAIAMLAYPAPGRWKLAGIAAGIAA